jgi:hypothetical protein
MAVDSIGHRQLQRVNTGQREVHVLESARWIFVGVASPYLRELDMIVELHQHFLRQALEKFILCHHWFHYRPSVN